MSPETPSSRVELILDLSGADHRLNLLDGRGVLQLRQQHRHYKCLADATPTRRRLISTNVLIDLLELGLMRLEERGRVDVGIVGIPHANVEVRQVGSERIGGSEGTP